MFWFCNFRFWTKSPLAQPILCLVSLSPMPYKQIQGQVVYDQTMLNCGYFKELLMRRLSPKSDSEYVLFPKSKSNLKGGKCFESDSSIKKIVQWPNKNWSGTIGIHGICWFYSSWIVEYAEFISQLSVKMLKYKADIFCTLFNAPIITFGTTW